MTRVSIHGGHVDVLCACGHPCRQLLVSPLEYGFRLSFHCIDCNIAFALDVIE
jgi:hypothetical protein